MSLLLALWHKKKSQKLAASLYTPLATERPTDDRALDTLRQLNFYNRINGLQNEDQDRFL
ncbi:hypothetical protein H6771_02450 [Candidatus Peribacteria bacterium]|nr:hypothetical protein [Candidatus Peribacteria bacterium]